MSKTYISDDVFWIPAKEYKPSYELSDGLLDARVYLNIYNGNIVSFLHSKAYGIGLVDHEFFELAGDGIGSENDIIERYDTLEETENRIKDVII